MLCSLRSSCNSLKPKVEPNRQNLHISLPSVVTLQSSIIFYFYLNHKLQRDSKSVSLGRLHKICLKIRIKQSNHKMINNIFNLAGFILIQTTFVLVCPQRC